MSTKVAIEHRTTYRFDRKVDIGPHLVRLRPAPHTRTPVEAYSLDISPAGHSVHWQTDPYGNMVARIVFAQPADELEITVGLIADLQEVNPFDFFVEDYAADYPFAYPAELAVDLESYLSPPQDSDAAALGDWFAGLRHLARPGQPIVAFLSALNAQICSDLVYSERMEAGVQSPAETLARRVGSCRDSAWLLVAALRHRGIAARFVSGYLVQLAGDNPDAPGPAEDFSDLHAWAEAYLPGAGWVGLDATSGLFTAEGHLPLSASPRPSSSAPISGTVGQAEVAFSFANTVRRLEDPSLVTRPYPTEQRERLDALGEAVDERLSAAGVELTMGGEPTFVGRDEAGSAQWTVAADGEHKRERASALASALAEHYGDGGLIQRSQGKWYPGEALPRWQIALIWRRDGRPLWSEPKLLADPWDAEQADPDAAAAARALAAAVTSELGLPADQCLGAYEDPLVALAAEMQQPVGPASDAVEVPGVEGLEALDAVEAAVAWVLPLVPDWWGSGWASPAWRMRRGRLVLVPGELPAGARLPLNSVGWRPPDYSGEALYTHAGPPLDETTAAPARAVVVEVAEVSARTALVIQAREGFVYAYLPPWEKLDHFVELVQLLERVAAASGTPIILEGYAPPPDPRISVLMVTPDPGVIEVNLHPTSSWPELRDLTRDLYTIAAEQRLTPETFAFDGRHQGTGGGNHLTLGAAEASRSPLLRRPDLLVSLLTFWQHHPALSYLFSGRFVGPSSQAPRVDETRPETPYELEIAFAEIERLNDPGPEVAEHRPWDVDRALRDLLCDVTGNTHRSEFCIDKLYSPDSTRGRLGLLELRGFEMPPDPDMSLVQALLVRALLARFAEQPYAAPLVRWGSSLHERYLLPHFVAADAADVVADLRRSGFQFELAWLQPFLDFRFPQIGRAAVGDAVLELRAAIEPWHVLGDDASSGGTSRYVDSATERLQVAVEGFAPGRHLLACNGVAVPLTATDTSGRHLAGVRFRAWAPSSARHPSLEVDAPLRFELVDRVNRVSLGGATYHVVDPSGRAYDALPVDAAEAEARRTARFQLTGPPPGGIDVDALTEELSWRQGGADSSLTLDLRRRLPRSWGRTG